MPQWITPHDYEFIHDLPAALIAWEFLRRNQDYIKDYSWFINTWNTLQAEYGSPPQRDFAGWKQDPRAYRSELEIYQLHANASAVCAAEDDQLLIECWMGTKWGFYKFPVDPKTDHPQLATQLQWRTTVASVKVFNDNNIQNIVAQTSSTKLAILFDLTKSLKQQLQDAKQQLITRKKKNSLSPQNNHFILYLRILDALHSKVAEQEICETLCSSSNDKNNFYTLTKQKSLDLMNGAYRELCV